MAGAGMTAAERATILLGGGGPDHGTQQHLLLRMANRHGLIAGATGTGKTVTMQVLAEGFSAAGVPVVLADVKGDLGGMALPGDPAGKLHDAFMKRCATIGMPDPGYCACPVVFWDVFGEAGHPMRATVAEMGPLLLSRILELTEAQEGVMNIAFRIADEEGLPLLDLKDLQAMLTFLGQNARDLTLRFGTVSSASIGAIQRRLLVLETQGADRFLGEPALELADLMRVDSAGQGQVNILQAARLMQTPRLYATFLLWLLSQLFEDLPEVGDPEKPRLVFFFDEAHLLFSGAPRALLEKVEQVARLIRSKGVGVWFVTQNPDDVPEAILGQLGNRVQHALRAFTARDQQALRRAAQTYRANPRFSTEEAIREVGTGEALTSLLEPKGAPGVVERTLIRPPSARLGAIDDALRVQLVAASPLAGRYDTPVDRDSAHERLQRRAAEAASEAEASLAAHEGDREFANARRYDAAARSRPSAKPVARAPARRGDTVTEAFAKSFARQLGSRSGQALVRGVLGGLFKGR
jgi:DNA helicase HerA-like ATPase